MRIERDYRKLENIEEISIFDTYEADLYKPAEKKVELEKLPFRKIMNNIPTDINIFIPYKDGEDFIIHNIGFSLLKRADLTSDDIMGRLLSECSPMFNDLLHDTLYEVYKTQKTKYMRILYYHDDKIARLTNIKVIYENGRVFVLSEHKETNEHNNVLNGEHLEENTANLIESISQTGSYYKVNGIYYWTQGIYNILNRQRDDTDKDYNIIFDLVVPEDKPEVDKIQKFMDSGKATYNSIMRIKTDDGIIKLLELDLYSKFDEDGQLINHYGIVKDISPIYPKGITRPVDFLLNGFKQSRNMALLIDPLNEKQYEFSEGFYRIVEEDKKTYSNRRAIVENIVEPETVESFRKLFNHEITELNETFTYNVKGDPNNQKKCDIYIEVFEFNLEEHSIGFLTDITEEDQKRHELETANEHQKVLIKEVHHRVKNNLQILNSFLNLEKRAYKDKPNIIIDHMQSRLSSLAILHEKTYNTTDFQNINLKSFITDQDAQLKNLIGLRDGIDFESEVDENLNLSIEVINPLLLVIDELTMNAIKHAFPDKTRPNKKITKKISLIDDNTARLILKDNGVGIDDPAEMKSNLGCEIIKNLTKQLDGTIKLNQPEVGTEYELIFPINMEHTIN